MILQAINFEDKFRISIGRELFFMMTKKEVYRNHHYLTKIKMDLCRFYWNNSSHIKTYNLILMYDIVLTFIFKNYCQDVPTAEFSRHLEKYTESILDNSKFENLNYLLFNDLCEHPIESISNVMNRFDNKNELVMSLNKNNFTNVHGYIDHISMVTKYFIPLEQDVNKHSDFIKEYTKDKFFKVGNIVITDYDIYLLKTHIFNKNIDLDIIYRRIERFSDDIKGSFLYDVSNSSGHENVIEVMEFIRKFDVTTIKTDILTVLQKKAMSLRYL